MSDKSYIWVLLFLTVLFVVGFIHIIRYNNYVIDTPKQTVTIPIIKLEHKIGKLSNDNIEIDTHSWTVRLEHLNRDITKKYYVEDSTVSYLILGKIIKENNNFGVLLWSDKLINFDETNVTYLSSLNEAIDFLYLQYCISKGKYHDR